MSVERAVFMDKDGTLVRNVPYNVDPDLIALEPGAAQAVAAVARRGFRVIVVSNQPGVALGFFPEEKLSAVKARLQKILEGALDGFYYCAQSPEAGCGCRKPNPGLLERAAREHGIDLGRSWMVGDILDDIEAGRRAGCRTVLINNGNETEWRMGSVRCPDHIARRLDQAAAWILSE